jgi:FkbH-like protein
MRIADVSVKLFLHNQKAWRREFRSRDDLIDVRVAVLAGSTANEVMDFIELLLLDQGIRPVFYLSDYDKYFEEAVLDPAKLIAFRPNIVYIHTSSHNIQGTLPLEGSDADLNAHIAAESGRFASIWSSLDEKMESMIIQNNFELPPFRLLGNFDAVSPAGRVRFINSLNDRFAHEASTRRKLFLNDLHAIAARIGCKQFHDARRWFSYKIFTTPEASLAIAKSVAAIISGIYGRSRKCLVLDLDNTLWGGIIGDDGPDKIKIGRDTALGEAYSAFQEYCLQLRNRGVLLAACSKNSEQVARQGFEHPDSILQFHHFSSFKANWEPKHENIKKIADELNIGLDSLVFVDDNPAERELVSAQLPMVAVPDVGSEVTDFISALEEGHYFEPIGLSKEDLSRASQYESNAQRAILQSKFESYDAYLESLAMTGEIAPFKQIYLERITQLVNKTNQFNLTARRYTIAEIERIASDPAYITLYGRLADKFGDNGLVSVIIALKNRHQLHIDLWLMSCRVLKRGMELAMLDSLVAECRQHGITEIYGYYMATGKNMLVAEHYACLGFEHAGESDRGSLWKLRLPEKYVTRNKHIKELVNG